MQFRRKIVRMTLLTLISTLSGAVLGAFLGRVFHRDRALTNQDTLFENSSINQHAELIHLKDAETNRDPHTQIEKLDSLKVDRSTSEMAHSAQLTLISILVGAIIGALLAGLPNGFAIHIWSKNYLDLDFRVLATFLAAVDLWIKYSWAVMVIRWPFTVVHNLFYFVITGALMFWALSVGDYNSWLAWAATVSFVITFAYLYNFSTVLKEKRRLHREVGISEDPRQKELDLLSRSLIISGSIELLVGIIFLYFTLNAFQVLPIWAMESYSPTLIGGFTLAFVALDLLLEGTIFMPREKYGVV
jgi:hypothetical protein